MMLSIIYLRPPSLGTPRQEWKQNPQVFSRFSEGDRPPFIASLLSLGLATDCIYRSIIPEMARMPDLSLSGVGGDVSGSHSGLPIRRWSRCPTQDLRP